MSSILRNSKGSKKYNRCIKWKLTVLEAYWELEARKGTKMTAKNSTFSSFALFLVSNFFRLSFFRKVIWPPLENRTFITLQLEIGAIPSSAIPDLSYQDLRYRHAAPTVSSRNHKVCAVWFSVRSERSALSPRHTTYHPLRNRVLHRLCMDRLHAKPAFQRIGKT